MTAERVRARKAAGAILLGGFGALSLVVALAARATWRHASGEDEAERGLARIAEAAARVHAERGRLCPTSQIASAVPMADLVHWQELERSADTSLKAEQAGNTGFVCLGLPPESFATGSALFPPRDAFSYESDGDRFVARAFRSWLYDPDGLLPRYEITGRVVGGELTIERRVRRIEPGGLTFPGHPSTGLYD